VNSAVNMEKLMTILKSASDKGSFTRTTLNVPDGYSVSFENRSIKILKANSSLFTINSSHQFLNNLSLVNAKHEVELFYGESEEIKNNTIYFL